MSLPVVDSGVLLILGGSTELLLPLRRTRSMLIWNPVYFILTFFLYIVELNLLIFGKSSLFLCE